MMVASTYEHYLMALCYPLYLHGMFGFGLDGLLELGAEVEAACGIALLRRELRGKVGGASRNGIEGQTL